MAYPWGSPDLDVQSLHAFLVSCSDDIVAGCRAVETFLREQPPEAALGFFRLCFPVLLQKVFGFQESVSSSSTAWLVKATDERSLSALRSLLHPSGPLFAALLALDREKAVQFVFPNERLPCRVRHLLMVDRGMSFLTQSSELFKDRIKVSNVGGLQLQLDLLEYYIFWFAYYAASCNDHGSSQSTFASKQGRPTSNRSFGSWVSNMHHPFYHNGRSVSAQYGLYLELLHLYLDHFVQSHHFAGMVYTPGTTHLSQGGFLLLTFIEFWLMNDDPWPTHVSQPGGGYTHSSLELQAVRLLVDHVNSFLRASMELQNGSCEGGSLVLPYGVSGSLSLAVSPRISSPRRISSISSPNGFLGSLCILQRPLYRFIHQAFLYWPSGIPLRQAWYLIELWVDYMQPWNADFEDKSGRSSESSSLYKPCDKGYSVAWESYVISNRPFYTALLVHFLQFSLKYVTANLELVLEMTAKVLGVLAGSKELLNLVKKLDHSCHTVFGSAHDVFTDMDWEDGIVSIGGKPSNASSSPLVQQKGICRLFRGGEAGASHALQMLILQIEAELHFIPPETQKTLSKALEYVRHAGAKIFCSPSPVYVALPLHAEADVRAPLQDGAVRALGCHTCFDIKYRGDWMRRPIESTEVAWLARFLVRASDVINQKLSLAGHENHNMTYENGYHKRERATPRVQELDMRELLKAGRNSVVNVCIWELGKGMKALLVSCWSGLCRELRHRGWRVNLRFLAQKPLVVLLLLLVLWWMLKTF